MEMDEVKLKEIEDRAAKATKGPWIYFGEPENNVFWGQIRSAAEDGHFDHIANTPELDERDGDMEFIAHAREDVPLLCQYIHSLVAQRDELLRAAKNACSVLDASVVDEPKSTNKLAFQQYQNLDQQLTDLRKAANWLRSLAL